jgi:pimeloyl-ACP methyl ester carboxylesterase
MKPYDLYVEEHRADDPDAPVIALVHGVFDTCLSFDGVIEHLQPDFTVLTYDRRGWARSADSAPSESIDQHANDLIGLLDGRRATLVGHSYGGTVALVAAVRRPDLVPAIGLFEPSMQWMPWWPTMEEIAEEAPAEQAHFRHGLAGRPRRTPEQRAHEQALLLHELELIAEPPFSLDELTVPRLVGRGVLSAKWRHDATDRLAALLHCDLVMIEDAGHTAHRMQPKAFAEFARQAHALGEATG